MHFFQIRRQNDKKSENLSSIKKYNDVWESTNAVFSLQHNSE